MPTDFDVAASRCSNATTEELPGCLTSVLGSLDGTRGVNEVWLRSFAIHVVALASYGHLLSVQGFTRRSTVGIVLGPFFFFNFAEFALAQVLLRTIRMIWRCIWHRERLPFRFFIAACLGMQAASSSELATSSSREASLVNLGPDQVECIPCKLDFIWLGRLGLLLALLAQYIGSAALWIRLVFFLKDRSYWHWHMDYRNFQVVFGGLVATLNSIGILLVGQVWKTAQQSQHEQSIREVEKEGTTGTPETSEIAQYSVTRSDTWQTETTLLEQPHANPFEWPSNICHSFSDYLNRRFPVSLQNDLELGVVIHKILAYGVVVWTFHRYPGGCAPIVRLLSRGSTDSDYTSMCPDRVDIFDPITFTLIPRLRNELRVAPWLHVPAITFNIALARILLRWAVQAAFQLLRLAKVRVPGSFKTAEHWLINGRSLLSFVTILFIFSLCPFWADGVMEQRSWHAKTESRMKNGELSPIDQIAAGLLLWKDPWQDNLYII